MSPRLRRWGSRALWIAGMGFVVGMVLLAVAAPASYVFVHETAQPEFCNSCHIMEPFYASWEASPHKDVACIECHYEPGAVETFEGKFQALSQLAKYVTRTQGTKPWAEVSDTSCLRSGCHSVRLLDGPVSFGEVNFDHAPHLFDPRPGRQLRCVTCHAQIVQSEHISVSEDVCFSCHFMPDEHGQLSPRTADCQLCHGAPDETLVVHGRPFDHGEYLARGVDCSECHDPVVEGRGTVRIERCKSCHADPEMIARSDEPAFLHEAHVLASKVECFECHDQIHHELPPLDEHPAGASGACATCHASSHDAARMVYAGRGANGVEDAPSRMHQTRVLCQSCHTGRSERMVASAAADDPHGGAVGSAGNVDCMHCHGYTFDGMLERWQATVASELERLRPALERAEQGSAAAARESLAAARADLELVERDGSLGAHNLDYTLDVLRSVAERVDDVAGAPFRSAHGCSTCHLGVESTPAALADGRSFSHAAHLAGGALDCDTCHSLEEHGRPAFPRSDCASCHHREESVPDPLDCAGCHGAQVELLHGTLPDTDADRAVMGELDCGECHGEPPDILKPGPALCVLCHEPGYDAMQGQWQHTVGGQLERLEGALAEAERGGAEPAACAAARASLDAVARDGSLGVHNVVGALDALRSAAEQLDGARGAAQPGAPGTLTAGLPFRSAQGCSTCHLGAESVTVELADGGRFPHAPHIERAGLDCDTCHSVDEHGQPAPERADCASCHHQDADGADVSDCARCHAQQRAFFDGTPRGLAASAPAMPDKGCTECHGEPPDIVLPSGALCVLCHEEGYDEQLERWRATTAGLVAELESQLEASAARGAPAETLERARAALAAVRGDGSRGVHNAPLAESLLRTALDALRE